MACAGCAGGRVLGVSSGTTGPQARHHRSTPADHGAVPLPLRQRQRLARSEQTGAVCPWSEGQPCLGSNFCGELRDPSHRRPTAPIGRARRRGGCRGHAHLLHRRPRGRIAGGFEAHWRKSDVGDDPRVGGVGQRGDCEFDRPRGTAALRTQPARRGPPRGVGWQRITSWAVTR